MPDLSESERLNRDFRTIRLIWLAMLAVLGLYVFAAHLIADELQLPGEADFPYAALKNILYVVSGATLVITGFVRRALLRSPARDTLVAEEPGATRAARVAAARYVMATLVSSALAETIGVYGFALFVFSGEFDTLYAFLFVSAAALLLYRPKREELENLALELKRKRAGG